MLRGGFNRKAIEAAALLCLLFLLGCGQRATPRKLSLKEVAAIDSGASFHKTRVETSAVVLYFDPEWHLLFVEDGGAFLYIAPPPDLKVNAGDRVRIVGDTSSTEGIESADIQVVGRGDPLPQPVSANPHNFAAVASEWVRLTGEVRWTGFKNGRAAIQLSSQNVEFPVYVVDANANDLPPIGSRVSVTGVVAAQRRDGKTTGAQILSPSLRSIDVLEHGPAHPFLLPLDNRAAELGQLRPNGLVHVSGDLHNAGTTGTLLTGKAAIRIELAAPAQSGDYQAEAVGFWSDGLIEDATVRAIATPSVAPGAIRHIAQLKQLSATEAAAGLPISVRAVVTYYDPDWGLLFVQENNAATFVDAHDQRLQVKTGDLVEVHGESSRGDFAPSIVHALVAVVRHGELPQPVSVEMSKEDLDPYESRWCTIRGIVHAVLFNYGHTVLRVRAGGSDVMVTLPQVISGDKLVDREVAITGALGVVFNDRKQAIGTQLFTPSPDLIRPTSDRPAGTVVRTISSLQRYNPNLDTSHSVIVHGVVVAKTKADDLFIQDNTGGLEIRGVAPFGVADGTVISVRGFVVSDEYSPLLEDAAITEVSGRATPRPVKITPEQALSGAFDAQFVSMQGVVGSISRGRGNTTYELTADGTTFTAMGPAATRTGSLRLGSTVEIHGICRVVIDRFPVSIRGFTLSFDSPTAVTMVRPGPWWTVRNIEIAVLLLVALAAVVLAWAAVLRRKVFARTLALRKLLQTQTNAQKFDHARNTVLEGIAANEPLAVNMQRLALSVEQQVPEATCVIVLAQPPALQHQGLGARTCWVVAPGLPEESRLAMQEQLSLDDKGDGDDPLPRLLAAANRSERQFAGGAAQRVDNKQLATSDIIGVLFADIRTTELTEFESMVLQSAAHLVSIAQNHSEIHQRLLHDAYHDGLTGLPNRTLVEDRLEHARARCERKKSKLTVLCIDLDGFKQVNDSMGHAAGDELLREISSRLQRLIRRADTIGRMGGDEFMAVLEDCNDALTATRVAEMLLGAVREPIVIEGKPVEVAASVGAAIYPIHGETLTELKRHADQAMYTAKISGGNRVSFWSPELRSATNMETEHLLRRGLEEKLFELRYQPIFDANHRVVAVEALLRFRAPDGKLLSPADFIEVAEETGLIVPIGEWVLQECCRQVKHWGGVPVAVNVSARQFAMTTFADVVSSTLSESAIDASLIELELTETVVMHDVNGSRRQMERLKALGVHIAVDDFGTGYSSLNYLHKLPIDILKIDRSFCGSIQVPGGSRVIVDAVVNIATTFGMTTVAEGVETDEQFASLLQAGCDRFQGYLFAKPMLAEELTTLIHASADAVDTAARVTELSPDRVAAHAGPTAASTAASPGNT